MRKKPIVLDAYTYDESALTYNPLQSIEEDGKCVGVKVPLWSDLKIEIGNTSGTDYNWNYADPSFDQRVSQHPTPQRGEFLPEKQYSHMKLDSPWLLCCSTDVYFMSYSDELKPFFIETLGGVLDFKNQHEINVNLMLKRFAQPRSVLLKNGQIIEEYRVMSERPIVFKQHLVSIDEHAKLSSITSGVKFFGNYQNLRGRCPFGFGGKDD